MKVVPAFVFSIAIIISAWLFSHSWKNTHHVNDVITVKGMAKKDFTSDLIIWEASFVRKSTTMQTAYSSIKEDAEAVKKYLVGKGVAEKNITFSAINIQRQYDEKRDKEGNLNRIFSGYELTQTVSVESNEVEKVEVISREITELINMGIELYSQQPRYYNTRLAELKLEMLAEATKDAKARAEKISENAGNHLGRLRKADMGVFQITGKNSSEDYSFGGTFNTSSKEKTASITVNLEFGVE
jgi:uncharacterized protein